MSKTADPSQFQALKTVYCPSCGYSNLSWRRFCQNPACKKELRVPIEPAAPKHNGEAA
jgi:hypothetical protein